MQCDMRNDQYNTMLCWLREVRRSGFRYFEGDFCSAAAQSVIRSTAFRLSVIAHRAMSHANKPLGEMDLLAAQGCSSQRHHSLGERGDTKRDADIRLHVTNISSRTCDTE